MTLQSVRDWAIRTFKCRRTEPNVPLSDPRMDAALAISNHTTSELMKELRGRRGVDDMLARALGEHTLYIAPLGRNE